MKIKNIFAAVLSAGLMAASLTGCANGGKAITVVSREDGSGTRSAFVELMGVLDADKKDATVSTAEINQSTNGVMMSVSGNPDAIGYISLGSLNDTVKAVKVDGVEATQSYTPSGKKGTISLNGSTSVGPVMEKLAAKYQELNSDVTVQIQQTGSGAGITAVTSDACNIGMSSRALKQEELDKGLTELKIADDGIAVIVNKDSKIDNLTSEQIKKIYLGEIKNWSEIK